MATFEPTTGDLVIAAGQITLPSNATRDRMLLRLLTWRGSCFWDLKFGSTLHLLTREKLGAGALRSAEDRAREALEPMRQTGELKDITVTASRASRNRLELWLSAVDAGRRPVTFSLFVEV